MHLYRYKLVAICTAVSASLFLASIVMCIKTFSTTMELYIRYSAIHNGWTREFSLTVESLGGGVGFHTENEYCPSFDNDVGGPYFHYQSRPAEGLYPVSGNPMWHWGGFNFAFDRSMPRDLPEHHSHYHVGIPYYAILAFLAGNLIMWMGLLRRRRKLLNMRICDNCGYDLRASPDRCPECGTGPVIWNGPA